LRQFGLRYILDVFLGSDVVRRFTFKTMGAWDSCALLAVSNHQLAMESAYAWEQSAHFERVNCFECLSPHDKVA